jgi:hypothetical protein
VLHALRIKGFAGADTVAEIAGIELTAAQALLPELAEQGWCRHIPARDLWQLSPTGRDEHGTLLPAAAGPVADGLRAHYEPFLELNVGFKDLCNRWQVRGDDANDHSDPAYDGERIAELRTLHESATPHLHGFAAAVERFETYERRLTVALTRLEGGETRMFTGVMCGSYHDIWMELHEDLVQLLGVDRHTEGSY